MNNHSAEFQIKLNRYFTLLFCILFCVIPLYPPMSSIEMAFVFRSCVVLFMGCMVWLYGCQHIWRTIHSHPLSLPLLFILLLALMGCFYSLDMYRAKARWAMYASVFLFFALIKLSANHPSSINKMIWSLLAGGLLTALYALFKQLDGNTGLMSSLQLYQIYDPVMQQELIKTLEANRAMGAFGNPNHLAGYLVLCLWCAWYLFHCTKNFTARFGVLLAGLVLVYSIYQTYSRSGLLVLGLSAVVMAAHYVFVQRKIPIKPVLYAFIPIAILFAGILYILKEHLLGGRLLVSSTVLARLHFFRGGWLIIQDHPWFGVGTEGFESFYSTLLRPGDIEARYVHNIVLEYALQWGLLGLAALFWLCTAVLMMIWKQRNVSSNPFLFMTAFGSALSLFMFSLVDFHNNLTEMYIIPIFFLACMGTSHPPDEKIQSSPKLSGLMVAALFCFWAGLVFCPFLNGVFRERGYYYSLDQQYSKAQEHYEWALFFDPIDGEAWNNLGHIARMNPAAHSPFFVLQYMENAVYWAPRRASFTADWADALFINGMYERAAAAMKKAQELFPARPVYYERLAAMYDVLNQPELAEQQRHTAAALKTEIEEKKL